MLHPTANQGTGKASGCVLCMQLLHPVITKPLHQGAGHIGLCEVHQGAGGRSMMFGTVLGLSSTTSL